MFKGDFGWIFKLFLESVGCLEGIWGISAFWGALVRGDLGDLGFKVEGLGLRVQGVRRGGPQGAWFGNLEM